MATEWKKKKGKVKADALPFHWGLESWHTKARIAFFLFSAVFPTLLTGMQNAHLTVGEEPKENTRNQSGSAIISIAS